MTATRLFENLKRMEKERKWFPQLLLHITLPYDALYAKQGILEWIIHRNPNYEIRLSEAGQPRNLLLPPHDDLIEVLLPERVPEWFTARVQAPGTCPKLRRPRGVACPGPGMPERARSVRRIIP
jgi:hypothetical protein